MTVPRLKPGTGSGAAVSGASRRPITCGVLLSIGLAFAHASAAQNTPGGNLHDNSGLNGSLSRADLEKLNGPKQSPPPDASQNTPEARAKIEAQGAELLAQAQVDCDAPQVSLVVSGTIRSPVTGRNQDTKVYEAACRGGLGYLLETRGADPPLVLSCLAAEAARAVDEQNGRPPSFYCKLPQNRDVKSTAATLLAATGASCAVSEWRWYGKSVASQSEYSEVACDGGGGYVLRTPMPGAKGGPTAFDCVEAARRGITCKLTAVAPLPAEPTLETFREALAKNGVACRVDQIREVGQEDVHKRYVVEYLCGPGVVARVALIPLASNKNPFEILSCDAASAIGVECALKPRR